MAIIPPPDVPVVEMNGRMNQRWYRYFFERDMLTQPIQLASYIELTEITAPTAPVTNRARLYAEDNGANKTQLTVLFPTGVAQVIKTEP